VPLPESANVTTKFEPTYPASGASSSTTLFLPVSRGHGGSFDAGVWCDLSAPRQAGEPCDPGGNNYTTPFWEATRVNLTMHATGNDDPQSDYCKPKFRVSAFASWPQVATADVPFDYWTQSLPDFLTAKAFASVEVDAKLSGQKSVDITSFFRDDTPKLSIVLSATVQTDCTWGQGGTTNFTNIKALVVG